MRAKFSRRHLLWLAPLAAFAVAGFAARTMAPPSELDLALSKSTEHGLYVASLATEQSPIPVGTIHSWTVKVTTADGKPADGIAIAINGGMPQHGHGLPTKPEVTSDLGEGRHLIEGMKFNMTGWWTLTVSINGPRGGDKATFNLVL
ncbi:FixH family protein [Mesorhizobium sp. VK23B]|uniref:FixH family protein n=1 Tax=Mesorhizobium dulcispinae TaxID=3072316 RepID=A0ABU4XA16_9HYPH|nr:MULTISPECIES: FixH family protein [unclassified Mesorhizobium]MDX8464605.1 FixH family protein [Mesorhizobium sp. VK23B]MDX8470991.1 FixH family protein [Mesorhizobium sp. VK23A]